MNYILFFFIFTRRHFKLVFDPCVAYLTNGKYNVFVVDWGRLSAIPCYVAAVNNMKPVAKCMAIMLTHLRSAGLNIDQLTCVGHSLGAHLCGMMANYLPFRMHRIIGMYIVIQFNTYTHGDIKFY